MRGLEDRFETNTITFLIDENRHLHCWPEVLFVTRGARINFELYDKWPIKNPHIMIQSIENSPFNTSEHRSDGPFSLIVAENATPGAYRFASAISGDDGAIYMDARCPKIIID